MDGGDRVVGGEHLQMLHVDYKYLSSMNIKVYKSKWFYLYLPDK